MGELKEGEKHYGPGLQIGYQYVAQKGLTIMTSIGAGYAVGLDDEVDDSAVQMLMGLGVGYTWR